MIDIHCENCGEDWYWEDTMEGIKLTFIHCPKCGSDKLTYKENDD